MQQMIRAALALAFLAMTAEPVLAQQTPPLTREQVHRLREEYSVYAIDSGRICVAALNSRNVDYVAKAVASVLV